jgi:hypothetical protein
MVICRTSRVALLGDISGGEDRASATATKERLSRATAKMKIDRIAFCAISLESGERKDVDIAHSKAKIQG